MAPRALLVPMSPEGHWTPFLHIIRQLVDHKVDLTLCTCQERADEIKHYETNGDFRGVDVEVVVVFSAKKSAKLTPELTDIMENELESKKGELKPGSFSCVISDMLITYCQELADDLGIPHYNLTTFAGHYALTILHAARLADGGWFDNNPEKDYRFLDAPGLENFTMSDLNWPAQWKELLIPYSNRTRRSAGLIINTFEELEQKSLDVLRCQLKHTDLNNGRVNPKVFTIGPLMDFPTVPSVESQAHEASRDYVEWLDERATSSVVFICFGSVEKVPRSTGMAVAKALESIQVPFLWALHLPPETRKEDVLPQGFDARTHERGLVLTSWVSQQEVLCHPSIGAFLSHCGWNSSLESITAGIPMVAHPFRADQHMNAKFLVSMVRVAVEINHEKHQERGEYGWEEIAEAIQTLMIKDEGRLIRSNMWKLQQTALKATAEGGSSHRSFQDLMNEIKRSPRIFT